MQTILILCFLGDPTLPAGSLSGTGGYNASVKDLLDFLVNTHTFNCIFITNTTGNYTETSTIKISSNITLYRLTTPSSYRLHKNDYSQEVESFRIIIEEIIKDFSTIVFIHSFYWLSGLIAVTLSKKYHIPFIHTTVSLSKQKMLSGYKPAINYQFEYENLFLHKAKYILAITEEEKRILTKYYHIKEDKIVVEGQNIAGCYHMPIYNHYGIPQRNSHINSSLKPIGFNELNISEGEWWNYGAFTYVGRINQAKGVDLIIKAWIELDKRFEGEIPPLWIVGSTPYEIDNFRSTLEISPELINKYDRTKRIVWWGYLNPEAISTIYLKTTALITHSAFEGGGRVIMEALCQGIPVISTDTGFGKDYIINWLNGFVVNYGDVETLMLRMSHFIFNPILSSVLGENAKNFFHMIESNWNHNERVKNLYNALINHSNYFNEHIYSPNYCNNLFVKGCIVTYPYYYHKPSLENIVDFTTSCIRENVRTSDFNQIHELDIWEYDKQYIAKNIYSKLNKQKIWNYSESNNVWDTYEIIKKYTFSAKSPIILSPLKISNEKKLMLLPYMNMLSYNEIENNIYEIATRLKLFSELSTVNDTMGISLVAYWKNLQNCIQYLNIKKIIKPFYEIPDYLKSFLSNPQNFIGDMCIQYAQPLLGHVGVFEDEIFFLPTYHWKYTQKGLDGGLLLFQLLLTNSLCPTTTLSLLDFLSGIWKLPQKQILGWSLCMCIENMICDVVFSGSNLFLIYKVYLHLIEIFNTLI